MLIEDDNENNYNVSVGNLFRKCADSMSEHNILY